MVDYGRDKKASHAQSQTVSFGDIIGQEELKRALLAVTADSSLSGLLIQGEKGTAKSTTVRALADLLPAQTVVEGCPYGCHPVDGERQCSDCRERTDPPTTERAVPLVTLPLGATRERVVGSLSVADALDGSYGFDPGVLARANRGILYVDEVNLLDDHLVSVLLDAAASGINRVERDGVSVVHPASFTLLGTMNPEEGDLRPQLRDRFALQATVTGCDDIDQRVAIVDQALGRTETQAQRDDNGVQTDALRRRLSRAQERLDAVTVPTECVEEVAELCRTAGVDGHRADIAMARAARAFAALDGRMTVGQADVRLAAELALPHRLQSRPFEESPDVDELIDEHFERNGRADGGDDTETEEASDGGDDTETEEVSDGGDEPPDDGPEQERDGPTERESPREDAPRDVSPRSRPDGERDSPEKSTAKTDAREGSESDTVDATEASADESSPLVPGQACPSVGEGSAPVVSAPDAVDGATTHSGTRSRPGPSVDNEGPRVWSRPADAPRHIDAAASVRAASRRGSTTVDSRDLRQSVRTGTSSALVVFVVDASASMRPAMRTAKGTVLELLKDAYQQRDEVAFVAFAGDDADVLLPPTDSVSLAARHLKELPTGDRTPLPAGIRTASEVIERTDPAASVVVLVTDGRANVTEGSPVGATRKAAGRLAETDARVVVVDAGDDNRTGLTETIVHETGGECISLSSLSAERIDATVGATRESSW